MYMQPHIPHHNHIPVVPPRPRPPSFPRTHALIPYIPFDFDCAPLSPLCDPYYYPLYPVVPSLPFPQRDQVNRPASRIPRFPSHLSLRIFTRPPVHGTRIARPPTRRNTKHEKNTQFSQPNEHLASLTKAPLSAACLVISSAILQHLAPRYCTARTVPDRNETPSTISARGQRTSRERRR
jgi:hypothetical protein